MFYLFLDESGELGKNKGSSDHFIIATLCTENLKALEKRIKKENAKLINAGWPKNIEIKGTTVWGSPHNPKIPASISDRRIEIITTYLETISSGPVSIHYSVAKKAHLKPHILNAEYGIAYNFLCGTLLCRAYKDHYAGPITLVVDQRNKETHTKMKFDGYLETRLIGDCEHADTLSIDHRESHADLGLQAVDFLSWSLFRHYEHKDPTFRKVFADNIGYRDDWYAWKK